MTRFARNRHPTTFGRMLERTTAEAGRILYPTAVSKQSKDLADLHGTEYEAGADEGSNSGLTLPVTGAPRRSSRARRHVPARPIDRRVGRHRCTRPGGLSASGCQGLDGSCGKN